MVIVCQANLMSSSCQASAGVSVTVTTRKDSSFLLPFLKQLTSRHPQPLFSPAVSEQIWDQLKGWRPWSLEISLQLSGHVRAPAGYNEELLTSPEGWTRRKPHAYYFTLSDTLLPYIVCAALMSFRSPSLTSIPVWRLLYNTCPGLQQIKTSVSNATEKVTFTKIRWSLNQIKWSNWLTSNQHTIVSKTNQFNQGCLQHWFSTGLAIQPTFSYGH